VGEPRVVTLERSVGLADVGPDARARLDAIARFVQDVADHDAATATVEMGVWILRRMSMRIERAPRLRAEVTATTWCTGVGARWAERTSQLHVGERCCVDTVAIWVHTDRETGAPVALPPAFDEVWAPTARGRTVSARLHHAPPSPEAVARPWPLRATDIDVVGHVNNAAYWDAIEDELWRRGRPRVRTAEIEFRTGLELSDTVELAVADREGGFAAWLRVGPDVRASVLIGCDT
jgi:acyl-ACP thioesterase